MVGVLIAGAAMTPFAIMDAGREGGSPEDVASVIEGRYAERIEGLYDESLLVRDASVSFWATVDYGLFKTGAAGMVSGVDGWLFSSEEYRTPEGSSQNMRANLAYADEAVARLREDGIETLIALLPPKTAIHPDRLRVAPPPERKAALGAFAAGLQAAGVRVVSLEEAMREAETQAFMARDTHWSPSGAAAAANAVANAAATVFADDPIGTDGAFVAIAHSPVIHRGDLMKFVPVGETFRGWFDLTDEAVTSFVAEPTGDAGDLFGDAAIPVALVGTSYSAQDQWSFDDALRVALGADVLNMAEEGGGPIAPMAAFLEQLDDMAAKPRLVIWEWPARFVDVDYSDAIHD